MHKKTSILLGFVLLKFVLQYSFIGSEYDLHRDEYLHLDQGQHLAWGFESVPPVTSWLSFLIALLGNGEFWVKFFPALFGALTMVVVWKAIELLNGNLFALILGSVSVLFSIILRINILYQPNSLDILLWTLFYFLLLKHIISGNHKWLYIMAVVFALGFLNKYSMVFLIAGLFPAILLTGMRTIFTTRHVYIAIGMALLLISPNLLWQFNNDFPVVQHMNELVSTQLENMSRVGFLKEQLLFFIGSVFVLIAALVALLIYQPFKNFRVFFWSYWFTFMLFTYLKAKGYYAIGLYPILLAFGSVYLSNLLNKGLKKCLEPVAVLIPVLVFIPISKFAFPNRGPLEIQQQSHRYKELGLLRWEDGKDHNMPQDFADMLGWKELAAKTDSAFNSLNDPGHTLVLCDNYGQAGAINYYSKNNNLQAVSFNADYINWFQLDAPIKHVILVKEIFDEDKNRDNERPAFESVTFFVEVQNDFARENGTRIYILKNAKIDMNAVIKKEIEERSN